MTQKASSRKTRTPKAAPAFPKAPATACICCKTPLTTGQGYDVPYIGVVGPKCVHKFGALAQAMTALEQMRFPQRGAAVLVAERLRRSLRDIGFEVTPVTDETGCHLTVGKIERKRAKVCVTWRERRAEFERDLKLAGDLLSTGAVAA